MEITKNTRVADTLKEYGDIADVMEVFGVKRAGRYSIRALAAKAVTVEWAARIHRAPLDEFLEIDSKIKSLCYLFNITATCKPPVDADGFRASILAVTYHIIKC